jgi:hypothetical protein
MLFGVVTSDELRLIQKQLDIARKDAQVANHNVNELVSVINQSRMAEQENRQRINELTSELRSFQTNQDRNVRSFNVLQNAVLLDETLALIEATEALIYREMHGLELIQRSLENGRLSETIFPVEILREVLYEAHRLDLVALPENWYYENIRIRTLMVADGWYTYQAILPFIGADKYLRYSLQSWPVPINGSRLTAKLDVQADIAINTGKGYLFAPQNCRGWNPAVCRTGPVYAADEFNCERGLLTSHEPDRQKCTVTLSNMDKSKLYNVAPGRYVIQTLGEDYTLACPSQKPVKNTLQFGTYIVSLTEGCTLQGHKWVLYGEILRFYSRNFKLKWVETEAINLPQLIPQEKLMGIKYDPIDTAHGLSWSNLIVSFIIIITLICLAKYVWSHRNRLRNFLGPSKPKQQRLTSALVAPSPMAQPHNFEEATSTVVGPENIDP